MLQVAVGSFGPRSERPTELRRYVDLDVCSASHYKAIGIDYSVRLTVTVMARMASAVGNWDEVATPRHCIYAWMCIRKVLRTVDMSRSLKWK